jgi:hypothetical protein
MQMSLSFDENGHIYRYGGKEIPSVSRILVSEGFINTGWFTDEGRLRGSAVHLHIKHHCLKAGCMAVPKAFDGYMNAWKSFEEQCNWKPFFVELPLSTKNEPMFAGTPDQIGFMNDIASVIDIKTGKISKATGLQLAAYEILINANPHSVPDFSKPLKRYTIQLNKDGKYSITEFKDYTDRYIFTSALAIYNWKRNNK